ncbi:type II toxin-antitoxin system VapC family toxin [Nodosilinea sp. PGN35]|uniref:type II toxin-antitoxin system VapC family toxin n=1 Tax=Nodosilinea sp. PGN35 TaxID=3020489 RepID=UPI0023B2FBF9|nr:type II toxin-antitoxin system VapC family toxin [Nodosilinea sp. TSF1-S3]MDF0367923.1 type II toxin-antitoxin system VapC family toxin [Nodosilinea sp. TSF1-S3]
MADYLLDTNILLRSSDSNSPWQALAGSAVAQLLNQNHQLWVTSQNLVEFWVVATRPVSVNGLGWDVDQTHAEIEQILSQFPQLKENSRIFSFWHHLVKTYQIRGKRVHDARLVAVMLTHGVTHLLTFNPDDFKTMRDIVVVHPETITEHDSQEL